MKKDLRTILVVLLALVFAISSAEVVSQLHEQKLANEAYEEAAEIALAEDSDPTEDEQKETEQPAPEKLPEVQLPMAEEPEEIPQEPLPEQAEMLLDLDLNALKETNEDVIGWIHIPDTVISYPLLRSEDNEEYLKLTWDLKRSSAGSIFLERRSSADLDDFHTLIYGHNMKNGTMFSGLHDYSDQEFSDSHSYVYIATEDSVLQYEIFSAYKAKLKSDTYRIYFEDDARKQSVIDYYIEQSQIESDTVPTVEDRILTLSTCTGLNNYSYRWVVHAVLTAEFPR